MGIRKVVPEGYNELDSLLIGLFNSRTPDKIETSAEDGFVYITFGNVVVKLDCVYVSNDKFEGNVYAVMSQQGEP